MLSLAFLRDYLGGMDSSADERLQAILDAEVSRVEGHTKRTFREPATLTEYHDGDGDRALELRCAITGSPSIYFGLSETALEPSTFYVDANPKLGGLRNLVVLHNGRWPVGERYIRAVYSGGYEAGEEPEEIRGLVADLVALRNARPGVASEPTDALPAHLIAIMDRWRYVDPQTRIA